jgi:hypothetical protein
MLTVDKFLSYLCYNYKDTLTTHWSQRDRKVLVSLSKQIQSGNFLTENQGKLLLKIIKENWEVVTATVTADISLIENPQWSEPFRVIEQLRKVFMSLEENPKIVVEFTYNKRIRQSINDLNKVLQGQVVCANPRQYHLPLTEQNIYNVVQHFKSDDFEIDEKIMDFYHEIEEIIESKNNSLNVFSLVNEKLISAIKKDVGDITQDNLILLNDRRIKYQYQISSKNPENSMKNSLANRSSTKVWINSKDHELIEVIENIRALNRFPLLVIFNGHDSKECLKNLEKLTKSAPNIETGIYFRFDNHVDSDKQFNMFIQSNKLNAKLSPTTLVAGIANNKLPKFMVKGTWYPQSVITFSNNFKNNKSSYYCDSVDLIVYYNDKQPLGGDIDAIM